MRAKQFDLGLNSWIPAILNIQRNFRWWLFGAARQISSTTRNRISLFRIILWNLFPGAGLVSFWSFSKKKTQAKFKCRKSWRYLAISEAGLNLFIYGKWQQCVWLRKCKFVAGELSRRNRCLLVSSGDRHVLPGAILSRHGRLFALYSKCNLLLCARASRIILCFCITSTPRNNLMNKF